MQQLLKLDNYSIAYHLLAVDQFSSLVPKPKGSSSPLEVLFRIDDRANDVWG